MSILMLLVLSAAPADAALQPGALLTYKGEVAPRGEDGEFATAEKTFELTLLAAEVDPAATKLFWRIEENGRGRWPWIERFGALSVDSLGKAAGVGPSLLYDREGETTVIPLPPLLLRTDAELKPETAWQDGKLEYEVEKAAKLEGREAWQIRAGDNYGRRRVLWRDKDSPLVLGYDQRVFMGMGQEYRLRLRLADAETLGKSHTTASVAGFEALIELRDKLGRKPRTEAGTFTASQLALLQDTLPAVAEAATVGPAAELLKTAMRDLADQTQRAGGLKELAEERVGRTAPSFSAQALRGEGLDSDDLKGAVTVLHFWEYRDSPLKQPYGQVGYLDFLYDKRKEEGVRVFGVAVDGRLRDEATRGEALRGVRKLRQFMNLGYPILLDDGRLLKDFGDPRVLGAQLPLFVLIGPDAKIAHWFAGHYEVDRQRGLKQLDEAVSQALEKRPAP